MSECTCRVVSHNENAPCHEVGKLHEIVYCPMHKSAPIMQEALEECLSEMKEAGEEVWPHAQQVARAALKASRGRGK